MPIDSITSALRGCFAKLVASLLAVLAAGGVPGCADGQTRPGWPERWQDDSQNSQPGMQQKQHDHVDWP